MADIQQFLEQPSSEEVRDKVGTLYMAKAKDMLMRPPFCYSEDISSEVAEGIVKFGDKIRCNCGEEDVHADELNAIGTQFQTLQNNIVMKVKCGENMDDSQLITSSDESDTSDCNAASLVDTLLAVRKFVKTKAQKGLAATVIMLCECNEDGVEFPSGQTVPTEIVENEIQLMLKERSGQIFPMAVNLVIESRGKYHHLSQVYPDHVDRFRM